MKVRVSEESNHCRVDVSVTVRNQGTVDGDEVVQLYLRDEVGSFTTLTDSCVLSAVYA